MLLSSNSAAPVNLQESETGAIVEEEVIRGGRRCSNKKEEEGRLDLRFEPDSNPQVFKRSRHKKRASLPWTHYSQQTVQSINTFYQARFTMLWRQPLPWTCGRIDCLIVLKGTDTGHEKNERELKVVWG
jgi:hypothetical protein